ncbi:MAG: DUF1326 domain-containing protein [Rhizobiales bacterium]|nr:DUF1326 domain-containing protein [Hyphomicrobiales bacterium]
MADKKAGEIPAWSIKGELALNCSCDVFCPCVVSLGQAKPSEGFCHAWLAVRIDEGKWGRTSLSGLNVALLLDIPGKMGDGNWTVAAYIDERASDKAFDALLAIFGGKARGTTGLFKLLVGNFLGARRETVEYVTEGKVRMINVPKVIQGAVEPIKGADPEAEVMVRNTEYWMGPDVVVARALKGRVRDFGRVWNFENRSAEICQISWMGP